MPKARAEPKVRSWNSNEWSKLKASLVRFRKFPKEIEIRWKNGMMFAGWLHSVEKNCQSFVLNVGFFERPTRPEAISQETLKEVSITYAIPK